MNWTIEFTDKAKKQMKKLDKPIKKRIDSYFDERVSKDPYGCDGANLKGTVFSGALRYRIGDYRALCVIKDQKITVLVLEVRHRSKAYSSTLS